MSKVLFCVAGALLVALSVGALGEGTGEGSFARNGIGARALALGGAFVAVADDASAGFWNPAGIGSLAGYRVGGTHVVGGVFGDAGITFQDVSLSVRPVQTEGVPSFGLAITWINEHIADIPLTGDDGGTFTDDQSLFLLSLSLPFVGEGGWTIAAGANFKYYRHTILTGVGSGVGFDLGLLFKGTLGDIPVCLGAVSMDTLETTVSWQGTTHDPDNYVPWVVKLGASTILFDDMVRLAGDVDLSPSPVHSDSPRYSYLDRLHLGTEILPIGELAIRGGVIFWRDGTVRLSAGLGIVPWSGLTIHYAYVQNEYGLGDTHILSAEFALLPPAR